MRKRRESWRRRPRSPRRRWSGGQSGRWSLSRLVKKAGGEGPEAQEGGGPADRVGGGVCQGELRKLEEKAQQPKKAVVRRTEWEVEFFFAAG